MEPSLGGPEAGTGICCQRVDVCRYSEEGFCRLIQRVCPWTDRERNPQAENKNPLHLKLLVTIDKKLSTVLQLVTETGNQKSGLYPPPTQNEAARVFALMKTLKIGSRARKAPLHEVFQLLVLDDLPQNMVARLCDCSAALISERTRQLERRFHQPLRVLRALRSQLREMASVQDPRAANIYRGGLEGDAGEDD